MGEAKRRSKQIAFTNIVNQFVADRMRVNRYGGDIGVVPTHKIRRDNTGRKNACIDNAGQHINNIVGPAVGWLLAHRISDNIVECVPHMWNINFKTGQYFDTTPFDSRFYDLYSNFAYVWDSDMYMHYCENQDTIENYLPGIAYIQNGKYYNVLDMDPFTGSALHVEEMTDLDIANFSWDYIYDDGVSKDSIVNLFKNA